MVIGIIGENCSGKSTLATEIQNKIGAEVITGKDYLRMAKSESEATALFKEKLCSAVHKDNIVYVISDAEHIKLLPDDAIKVLVTADIDTIKSRFKERLHGNLPMPVEQMLEKKHGMFDAESVDFRYDGVNGDASSLCRLLEERIAV
ncbi:hypothetical protein [Butyrivibrio sp. INlla16]|uniref:hypothetical protein n=1 Tax=Butyrivibrio sp. INlla16 TaxID=1520807 RepID=UPI000889FF47|nr:hypothetical protein [Butyrivibrio sp. INlla16]SDB44530.1 hypothetical protein SAMN02910263_02179 [Butyrivibrio sp. INlla16]